MRIKLDENLPAVVKTAAQAFGHDVDTVLDEMLGGATDDEVFAAAVQEGRFLITLDRGFGDVRRYRPGTHPGIAILRVDRQDTESVIGAVRGFLSNDTLGDITGCIVVVRGHLIRIRRPE